MHLQRGSQRLCPFYDTVLFHFVVFPLFTQEEHDVLLCSCCVDMVKAQRYVNRRFHFPSLVLLRTASSIPAAFSPPNACPVMET